MPNYAVRFPGSAGNYYHLITSAAHTIGNVEAYGQGGCVAWVRIDSSGYATIFTTLGNWNRCFTESVPPVDPNEWNYQSTAQSYIWFGIENGNLTLEIQDGRLKAKSFGDNNSQGSGDHSYSTPGARDGAVAFFRDTFPALPYNDGLTVPIPTYDQIFPSEPFLNSYHAILPGGVDGPYGGPTRTYRSLYQKVKYTGPALTPGQWYRVGYRWTSVSVGQFWPTSSTIELFVDCVAVLSQPWDVSIQAEHGYYQMATSLGGSPQRYDDIFVGGDPVSDQHRQGATVTPIDLYDVKVWLPSIADGVMETECDCDDGTQPTIWWKMRDASDVTNFGTVGASWPALPVGSRVTSDEAPVNPCTVGPPPPPPEPPPAVGTVIVIKQLSPDGDPTAFSITALVPPPAPVVFSLTDGASRTFNNVPVGAGYSVVEALNPLYTTAYTVSNGGLNTSFAVAANEVVTVTINNTLIVTTPEVPLPETPPVILSLDVNCLTARISATGQYFTDDTTVAVTQNAQPVIGFTILERAYNYLLIGLPGTAEGTNQFCVTVSDGLTPMTLCATVVCEGCPQVLDDPTERIIVTVAGEPVVTLDSENIRGLAP